MVTGAVEGAAEGISAGKNARYVQVELINPSNRTIRSVKWPTAESRKLKSGIVNGYAVQSDRIMRHE